MTEVSDVSPWLAMRLVRWAAKQWIRDSDLADGYAEEWAAVVDRRPGKFLKLATAIRFAIPACGYVALSLVRRCQSWIKQAWLVAWRPKVLVILRLAVAIWFLVPAAGYVAMTFLRGLRSGAGRRRSRIPKRRALVAVRLLVAECTAFIAVGYSVANAYWLSLGWSLSTVIALPTWLILVAVPVRCGVLTRHGHSCRNVTTGVLFGCSVHRGHAWEKFLGHLAWIRGTLNVGSRGSSGRTGSVVGYNPTVTVSISKAEAALFWLAITSTATGVISFTAEIAAMFGK